MRMIRAKNSLNTDGLLRKTKLSGTSLLRIALAFSTSHTAEREVVLGICSVRSARRWELLDVKPDRASLLSLKGWAPDAVVIRDAPSYHWARRVAPFVISVMGDLTSRGVPSVLPDDRSVGEIAANYFADKGMKRIAFFQTQPCDFASLRAEGVADVCARRGVEFLGIGDPRCDLLAGKDIHRQVEARVRRWVRSLPTPCGVVIGCDGWAPMLAFNVLACGLDIPQDIALLAADNDEVRCEMLPVPLSSVKIPWREVGVKVATMIENAAQGGTPDLDPICFEPTGVQERNSSDQLAVDDPYVQQALTIIHQRIDQPLTVKEILRHVPANRRHLERAFVKHLGRTIHEEARRLHIEQAKKLLVGTDLSMPMVARRSGFSNATRMGISFRKETSLTPTEYRRRFQR